MVIADNKGYKSANPDYSETFVLILGKLDEQIAINKMIFDRLNELENTIKKTKANNKKK